MKTYKNLYQQLLSQENLNLAYENAKKGKSQRKDIIEFTKDIKNNLSQLRAELILNCYHPEPLKTFVIRDPKTRKIRKSQFRDRIIHHAICNILVPIFDKTFIFDSYANRKGKGTLSAIERFEIFSLKASKNNTKNCYVLKADIKHYFEEIDHSVLLDILGRKIKDQNVMGLIRLILKNNSKDVGMPLGNLTSQTFQNIYLNELDQFVKHQLRAKYYIRYVDDFVILSNDKAILEEYKSRIAAFLKEELKLVLHPSKTKILSYRKGVSFLGFRIFPYHKLLRRSSIRDIKKKIVTLDYDSFCVSFQGWLEYASKADTFKAVKRVIDMVENTFVGFISGLRINQLIKEVR